jgi:hypothetical protein
MGWYPSYLILVAVLWAFSSQKDRNSLRIILIAGVASYLITLGIHGVTSPWRLIVPATIETATIIALLKWANNRQGLTQVALLVIAWAAHLLCYFDLMAGTNIVYDAYEKILLGVAVGQILACHDTVLSNVLAIRDALFRLGGRGDLHPASGHASVLHPQSGKSL